MRALILLRDRFFQNVVHIFIFQCFFEFFLSGRVDSFSDDTRHIIQDHSLSIRRYDRIMLFLDLAQRKIFAFFYQLFNMFRCRSAASADHTGSSFYNLLHDPGKLIRLYIVIRFPVLLLRKSGIWLHNDRKGGISS